MPQAKTTLTVCFLQEDHCPSFKVLLYSFSHREFAMLRGCWSRCLAERAGRHRGREAFNLPVEVALHHERQADVGDEIITIIKPSVAFIKQLI